MKEGLIYISDRLGQLRYSDKDDKIKWLQPLSSYKALVEIKRGQAVSVATLDEIKSELSNEQLVAYEENPSPYIVPTNTKIHNRCIGLALETVEFGADVHILGSGQFEYITDNSNEYNPGFTDDDISKKVYVSNMPGELTTDSEVAYKEYNNIIQIGHIIDAPNPDASSEQKKIILEVQIQGDDRGILESTQFEAVLGEDVYIGKDEPLTVFAFGQEEASKFKLKLCTRNIVDTFTKAQLDASFIIIKKLSGEYSVIKFSNNEITTNDINDNNTLEFLKSRYTCKNSAFVITDINFMDSSASIKTIKDALNIAIKEMGGDLEFTEIESSTSDDNNFSSVTLELNKNGGYYDIYFSDSLKDFLRDTTVLQNGSLSNKNRVVLADIRVDARKNVFGVLVNKPEDDKHLKQGDRILLMRQGELVVNIEKELDDAIGKKFNLGENGTVICVDDALRTADSSNMIGYLKKTHNGHYHFVIDIGENIPKIEYSTYPVGYLKPYYGSREEGEETPDFGYLVTGKIHPKKSYKELYERLLGWYNEDDIDRGDDHFEIPEITDINGKLMQIKYVTDGIFERLPKVPYLRDFGNIAETEDHACKIEDLDITALLSINTTFSKVDTLPLENLDIHLYIDPGYTKGEHNWKEVRPGFYKYNNVDTYGFEWKLEKKPATPDHIYGQYILSVDIGDSRGIYYTSDNNVAPISCNNVPYKLYVAVKQINIEHFDLRNLMSNYISNTVYNSETGEADKIYAVTGSAVVNAIRNNEWFNVIRNETKDSIVDFGETTKLNTTVNIQTNKAIRLNCSVESNENAVLIGETNYTNKTGETLKNTTLEIKDGKAFLNKLNTDLFAFSGNDFSNKSNEIATVDDVLDHALMSIDKDVDVKDAIIKGKLNDKGRIHGMIFGKGGNVDASTLCSYNVDIAFGQEITNVQDAIIPLSYKASDGIHTPLQGNLDYYTNVENKKSTKLFTLLPNYVTEDGILNLAFTKDNEKVDKISFDTATIVATTESPSLSRYKTIYEENKTNDGRFTTELDEGSKPTTDDKISFDFAYILQAAYELPLAYWKYRNSDEYNIGPIIERLQDTINYFENKEGNITYTIDGDKDPYKYTEEQKTGIAKSLKDIIAESGKSVRADDMVGFLLAAAGETQKRLAKLERSTYGRDVMEGKIIEFDNIPDVTPDHTRLGLNRLVRAICLELFDTADPLKFDEDLDRITSLSTIDAIERQIRGSKNTPDGVNGSIANNSINNFEDADDSDYSISNSYPYKEDIEKPENVENIKNEDITSTESPTAIKTKETIFGEAPADDTDSFNGVVDAIYRITQKVDVLTEAVNGTNDILQPHTTLNKIKRNIETLIQEVYFDGENGEDAAYKDVLGKGDLFDGEKPSRVDEITKELYEYKLKYENWGTDTDETQSTTLEKYKDLQGATYDNTKRELSTTLPSNINNYKDNFSIIDIILKAIGNQILLKHYVEQGGSAKKIRFNKDISERLYNIEQCLDKVVLRLKDSQYFENFTTIDFNDENTTLNIDAFSEALSGLLGYTYNKTDNGKGKFSPTEGVVPTPPDAPNPENSRKFSAEYALRTKSNIVAGLENILYRVQNEEKDNLHIKTVLGEELMGGITIEATEAGTNKQDTQTLEPKVDDNNFNLSDDIKDLLATIYGEALIDPDLQKDAGDNTAYTHRTKSRVSSEKESFLNGKNIIENIVNELYYIPQPFDKDFNPINTEDLNKTDNIYVTYNGNVNENFFEGSLIAGNNREHNFKSLAKSGRPSRLDILESDIKALRKFIGLADILDDTDADTQAKKDVAVQGNFSFDKEDDTYGVKDSSYVVGSKDPLTSSFIESFFNLMKRVDVVENTNTSQSKSIEAINDSINSINENLGTKADITSLEEAVDRIDTLESDTEDLQDKKFAIENIINLDDETGVLEVYSKKAVENLLKTTAEDINTNVAELKASVDEFNNTVDTIDGKYSELSKDVQALEDVVYKDEWNSSEGNLTNHQEGTDAIITLNNFKKFRYLLPDSPIAQEYYNIKGKNDVAFCNATKVTDNEHKITIDMKNTASINIYVTDFETVNSKGEDDKVYSPFIYNLSRNPVVTIVTDPSDVASKIEDFNGSIAVPGNTHFYFPTYKAEGYTFDGWYQGDTKLENQEKYLVDDDVTLIAKFEELDKHTVTYITDLPQDITVNDMPEDGVVYHGSAIQKPETDPLAEGYKFTGWYIGEKEVSYPHTVESNITITAKFVKVFTVTYNIEPEGITVEGYPKSEIKELNEEITELPDLSHEGYDFNGWCDEGGNIIVWPYTVIGDVTLTAKFTKASEPDDSGNGEGGESGEGGENVDPPNTGTEGE